jgi:RHS repeat-associated protein
MNFRNYLARTLFAAFALTIGSQAYAARTTTFFHGDGLSSVVAATNEAGTVLWRKDYAPFGEQIQTQPVAERTSYTGKQHDDLTGLTYFGGRNFDPELGRFVSVDPVAFMENNTMSFNRYLYVNNNPYKYVDPDGELLNFALKFVFDVAINVALNYVTTGEMNVGGALKESALGILNPAKGLANGGKLVMALTKVNKVAPSPAAASGFAQKVASNTAAGAVTKRPSRVRRGTERENWDNAENGPTGGKNCPTCGKEVTSPPNTTHKDWQNDHDPKWKDRDLSGKSRHEVLNEYNQGTRLRCTPCNLSDNK